VTAAGRRRTVAEMDARLAKARELMVKMREDARAEYERSPTVAVGAAPLTTGVVSGFDGALSFLDWAFSPEQDWMWRK
jgi:hypothetical protein